MKTLYFCSHDGNHRRVFKSEEKAEEWKNDNGSLASVADVVYNENNANEIVSVYGQDFIAFVESISDEVGSEEFERVYNSLNEEWAYTESTDD